MNAFVMDNNVLPVDFMNVSLCVCVCVSLTSHSLHTILKQMKIECVFKVMLWVEWKLCHYNCVDEFNVINR